MIPRNVSLLNAGESILFAKKTGRLANAAGKHGRGSFHFCYTALPEPFFHMPKTSDIKVESHLVGEIS
jgi:hypothetical protein